MDNQQQQQQNLIQQKMLQQQQQLLSSNGSQINNQSHLVSSAISGAGQSSQFGQRYQRPLSRGSSPNPRVDSFERQHRANDNIIQSQFSKQPNNRLPQPFPDSQQRNYNIQNQPAKNLRTTQQKIARDNSLDLVEQIERSLLVHSQQQSTNNNSVGKTFASGSGNAEGNSFASLNDSQINKKQEVVRKVLMQQQQISGQHKNPHQQMVRAGSKNRQSSFQQQQQASQVGPHNRSKSSAMSKEQTAVAVTASIMNQVKERRKSNSRGRATPSTTIHQNFDYSRVIEDSHRRSTDFQNHLFTQHSPKPKSTRDLNTSQPLQLSKSHRMQIEKQPSASVTGRPLQQFKSGSHVTNTVQSTKGNSQKKVTKRSTSKKRASMNTSLHNQKSKSPSAVHQKNFQVISNAGQGQRRVGVTGFLHSNEAQTNSALNKSYLNADLTSDKMDAAHIENFLVKKQQAFAGINQDPKAGERKNKSLLFEVSAGPNGALEPVPQLVGYELHNSNVERHDSESLPRHVHEPVQYQIANLPKMNTSNKSTGAMSSNMRQAEIIHSQAHNTVSSQKQNNHQSLSQSRQQNVINKSQVLAANSLQSAAGGFEHPLPSQFSSFTKEQKQDMKHQSAQKILRRKNPLMMESSQSPNSNMKRTANLAHLPKNDQQSSTIYAQQMQSKNQQQQLQSVHNRINNLHNTQSTSSAQSVRTAQEVYFKKLIKQGLNQNNNALQQPSISSLNAAGMSSRTVNSSQSATTPYNILQGVSGTAQANQYGSSSGGNSLSHSKQMTRNENKVFKDFRPKTSVGTHESKSQMMLDRSVLSPEPRTDFVLTKDQIQKTKLINQTQISIPKEHSANSRQPYRLKFSQIQQASHINQPPMTADSSKQIIKSQRVLPTKHHTKSFSNSQSGSYMFLESKNVQVMHQNFMNPIHSELNTVSGPSKTVRQFANKSSLDQAYSGTQSNQKAASSMGVHQSLDQPSKQPKFRQVGLGLGGGMVGQQTRQKLKSNDQMKEILAISEHQNPNNFDQNFAPSQPILVSIPSSQSSKQKDPAVSKMGISQYVPLNQQYDEQAQSQKVLAQTNHQMSQGPAHHLKSAHIVGGPTGNTSKSVTSAGPTNSADKAIKGQSTSASIAEQSHQKILGPITMDDTSFGNEHNEYMNNAEDYYKKVKQKNAVSKLLKSRGPTNNTASKLKKIQHSSIEELKEKSVPRMHMSDLKPALTDEDSKACKSVDAQQEESKMIMTKGKQILGSYQVDSLQTENQPQSAAMVGGIMSPPERVGGLKMKLGEAQSAQNVSVPLSSQSQNSQHYELTAKTSSQVQGMNSLPQSTNNSTDNNKSLVVSISRLKQFVAAGKQNQQQTKPNQTQITRNKNVSQHSIQTPGGVPITGSGLVKMQSASKRTMNNSNAQEGMLTAAQPFTHTFHQNQNSMMAMTGSLPLQPSSKSNATKYISQTSAGAAMNKDANLSQVNTTKAGTNQTDLIKKKNLKKMCANSITQAMKQQQQQTQIISDDAPQPAAHQKQQTLKKSFVSDKSNDQSRIQQAKQSGMVLPKDPDETLMSASMISQQPKSFTSLQKINHSPNKKPNQTQQPKAISKQEQQFWDYYQSQRSSTGHAPAAAAVHQQKSQNPVPLNSKQHSELSKKHSVRDSIHKAVDIYDGGVRSQTAIAQHDQSSRYNQSQPDYPITDFNFQPRTPQSVGVALIGQSLANVIQKVDHKLNKAEMLQNSQLSTMSQSSADSRSGKILTHLVTFSAHSNSIIGLVPNPSVQNQLVSLSKDNTVKIWSVVNQKPKQPIHNNRAAAMNVTAKVVLKKQIRNQGRPSQKLSSFALIQMNHSSSADQTRISDNVSLTSSQNNLHNKQSILATGSTDRILRLYTIDSQSASSVAEQMQYINKDGELAQAEIIQPQIKVVGQHKGVITSIVSMPGENDYLLTGCSDHRVRLYSLSALSEESDDSLRVFDQGTTGVSQLCALSENTFLSGGYDNSVRLWDIRQKEYSKLFEDINYGKVTWIQKYNTDTFAIAASDGIINFWDTRMNKLINSVSIPNHSNICSVQFAKKRQYMLVAHDHKVTVVNMRDENRQKQSFTLNLNEEKHARGALETQETWGAAKITAMAYSENDRKLYTGGFNQKISVWNFNQDTIFQ